MMTSAQVVETSVNVTPNSPSMDYTHPDDHNLPNYDMTPGFKPFTVFILSDQREICSTFWFWIEHLARFAFCENRYFHDNDKQKTSKTLKLKFCAIQTLL